MPLTIHRPQLQAKPHPLVEKQISDRRRELTAKTDRRLINLSKKIPSVLIDRSIVAYLDGDRGKIGALSCYPYKDGSGAEYILALPYDVAGTWTEDRLAFACRVDLETFAQHIGASIEE